MQIGRLHAPPARHGGAEQHLRREILPDQRLPLRRDHEVLLDRGQRVRQRHQRADQPSSTAVRPSRSVDASSRPTELALRAEEVVAPHEQRIRADQFRAWRCVQGVQNPDERIPQDRRKLAADREQLARTALRTVHGATQVQRTLALHVPLHPAALGHGVGFFDREQRSRKANVRNAGGQAVRHGHIERLAPGHALQVVGEIENRVQGHEPLESQQLVHSIDDLAPSCRLGITRLAYQQVNQRLLGRLVRIASSGLQQGSDAVAAEFKHVLPIIRGQRQRQQRVHGCIRA